MTHEVKEEEMAQAGKATVDVDVELGKVTLFGNDIAEMTDAEVALRLAEAAYDRVLGEFQAAKDRYAAAEQRLMEAQVDFEEEQDVDDCTCYSCTVSAKQAAIDDQLLSAGTLSEANLAEELGFTAGMPAPFGKGAVEAALDFEVQGNVEGVLSDDGMEFFQSDAQPTNFRLYPASEPEDFRLELATLVILTEDGDEVDTLLLIQKYASDRDWFVAGAITEAAADTLHEEGRLG